MSSQNQGYHFSGGGGGAGALYNQFQPSQRQQSASDTSQSYSSPHLGVLGQALPLDKQQQQQQQQQHRHLFPTSYSNQQPNNSVGHPNKQQQTPYSPAYPIASTSNAPHSQQQQSQNKDYSHASSLFPDFAIAHESRSRSPPVYVGAGGGGGDEGNESTTSSNNKAKGVRAGGGRAGTRGSDGREQSGSPDPDQDSGSQNEDQGSASKKQKLTRIHQACISCAAKKQKCTGGMPCGPCQGAGVECIYKESKKRGPPKGSKRIKKHNDAADASDAPRNEDGKKSKSDKTGNGPGTKKRKAVKVEPDNNDNAVFGESTSGNSQREEPLSTTSSIFPQPASTASASAPTGGHYKTDNQQSLETPVQHLPGFSQHNNAQANQQPQAQAQNSQASYSNSQAGQQHQQQQQQQQQHPSNLYSDALAFNAPLPPSSGSNAQPFPFSPNILGSQLQLPPYEFGYPILGAAASSVPSTSQRSVISESNHSDLRSSVGPQSQTDTRLHLPQQQQYTRDSTSDAINNRHSHEVSVPPTMQSQGASSTQHDHNDEHQTVIEAEDASDARMLMIENAEHSRGDLVGLDSLDARQRKLVTEHYRGASSGIPSLHAHRHHSDEGAPSGSRRPRSFSTSSSARPYGPSNGYQRNLSPQRSRHVHPYDDSLRTHASEYDELLRDDDPERFTLPPIRLLSSRPNDNDPTSPASPVHIPKGMFDRLISYYFAISHHSCPIIYKPDIDIANIQNQMPQLLLDGMCCLAARFLENDDLTTYVPHLRGAGAARLKLAREQIEQHYYDRARKQIQEDDYQSSITTVQALLLLSKRDTGCGRMLHCWHLVGSATRMVIDLGMHRKAALVLRAKDTTYGQIETRRRTFWQAYIMDKHTAASLGRPVFLREEDIDVLLPSEVTPDEFERWVGRYPAGSHPPENRAISTHNAFARLSLVLQSIINDVYSTRARKQHYEIHPTTGEFTCYVVLRELHAQLGAWRQSLPPHLQWTPESKKSPPPPHQLLLHAFYHTCMLLLFRPVVPVSNQVAFVEKHGVPRPHDVCIQAADSIMQIMAVYESTYGLKRISSSTAVYYIFTAATIYVGNSSSLDPAVAPDANSGLQKCTDLLEHLSETCSTASQHRQILLDITRLGSTKLRSRDDAENLLSSRVPSQAQLQAQLQSQQQSASLENKEATPGVTSMKDNVNGRAATSVAPTTVQSTPQTSAQQLQPQGQVQSQAQMQNQTPNQVPAMQVQHNQDQQTNFGNSLYPFQANSNNLFNTSLPYQNLFSSQSFQPPGSTFMPQNNPGTGFGSSFTFQNDGLNMPLTANPSTNQADLAFWREMPMGEDANEWGFFTDQYANTLLSSLPAFNNNGYTNQS